MSRRQTRKTDRKYFERYLLVRGRWVGTIRTNYRRPA